MRPAFFAPVVTLSSSSVDITTPPVRRTFTPNSGVRPASRAIRRIRTIASAAGESELKSTRGCVMIIRRVVPSSCCPPINARHENAATLPCLIDVATAVRRSSTVARRPAWPLSSMAPTALVRTAARPRRDGSPASLTRRAWDSAISLDRSPNASRSM